MSLSILSITDEMASEAIFEARSGVRIDCPVCSSGKSYILGTRGAFKCAHCTAQFTLTSRTLLASQKMDDRRLYAAVVAFCGARKGISSPQLGRLIGCQQCTAFKLLRKFRHAIMALYADVMLQGVVEVDGAFVGGHIKHMNKVESGRSRRVGRYYYKDRRTVVVLKQRLGKTLTFVGKRESDAREFIESRVLDGAVIVVDQAHAWDGLIELYGMLRINHKYAFQDNQVHTNNAESYFSHLRKAQHGTYHRIAGANLKFYAQEIAWRRDHRESSLEEMAVELLRALLTPIRLPEPMAEAA